MDILLEYSEEVSAGLPAGFFRTVAEETLKKANLPSLLEKQVSLTAVAVSEEKIQELNREYRHKDAVTDILSFGEYADLSLLAKDDRETLSLGELYFCPAYIQKAAEEDSVTLKHEMAYIFSHGVLHLLGYDHSDEMFSIQDKVTRASLENNL